MKTMARLSLLTLLLCCALAPAALAERPKPRRQSVPEEGSPAAYLSLGAVACLGAMVVRSRREIS